MFLFKVRGESYLTCSESWDGRYRCIAAESDSLYGPYGPRYEAIPPAAHNLFFVDELGNGWSSYFGSDNESAWQEMPGVVPVGFNANGRVGLSQPLKTQKE